jgi:hypothetical protein
MTISKTAQQVSFPSWSIDDESGSGRYMSLPTPSDLKRRSLFGLKLTSAFTGETVSDETLQDYVNQAISEVEHELDLYITPVKFGERQDYNREMQIFSFGYLKLNHSPILNVNKFQLTFNNGVAGTPALVDMPLEFIHVQPQEGTIQLVPAQGTSISGFIASVYSGLGFHAFSSQAISSWPGAVYVEYTAGFDTNKVPALLVGLIENLAAYKFLSTLGPVLFPQSSVGINIDGVSQSVGTAGPSFLQGRLGELEKAINAQKEAARGHYQKSFLIDYL